MQLHTRHLLVPAHSHIRTGASALSARARWRDSGSRRSSLIRGGSRRSASLIRALSTRSSARGAPLQDAWALRAQTCSCIANDRPSTDCRRQAARCARCARFALAAPPGSWAHSAWTWTGTGNRWRQGPSRSNLLTLRPAPAHRQITIFTSSAGARLHTPARARARARTPYTLHTGAPCMSTRPG